MITFLPTQSVGASVDGPAINLSTACNFSVQIVWVGTLVGTVKLQYSNNGSYWSDVADSSQATGGADGSHAIDYGNAGFQYVRVVYTHTAGSGTMVAIGNVKNLYNLQ